MSFSWALYFAQACTSNLFGSVPGLENSLILSDGGDVWVVGRGCNVARWVYVDNLGAIGSWQKRVQQFLDAARYQFDKDGLKLHEIEIYESGGPFLGIAIDLDLMQTRNTD